MTPVYPDQIPVPGLIKQVLSGLSSQAHSTAFPENAALCALLMFQLVKKNYYPVFLVDSEVLRENVHDSLVSFFDDKSISYRTAPDLALGEKGPESTRFQNQLHHFLARLLQNETRALCSSAAVLDLPLPDRIQLQKRKFHFHRGGEYEYDWILAILEDGGYQRVPQVEHNGEFSVRGGIIDVYPFGRTYPLRLELFGNTLESIREFNPNSQLSTHEIESFDLLPRLDPSDPDGLMQLLPQNTVIIASASSSIKKPSAFPVIRLSGLSEDHGLPPWSEDVGDRALDYLQEILPNWSVYLFYDHELLVKNLKKHFSDEDRLHFIPHIIHDSFYSPDLHSLFLNADQLFHVEHIVNPDKQFIPEYAESVDAPSALKYGDFVLHSEYGVGRFMGIETLHSGPVKQDALVLEFQNADKVYVALKYINKIFKYSGVDEHNPRLASLRKNSWEGTRRSVRNSVKAIAEDLLSLYGERHKALGYAFLSNDDSIRDIEESFPHTETPDQKSVIDEIYADMESSAVMDRLVCGDVGFGKTEVAVRAAFKAVLSSKQVAVLVPTTILSIQHYETFSNRLKAFGINIDILNRFRTGKDLNKLYTKLADGRCDVLIGTHKMLSEKVQFKDLGLLIVDEEHRFGVRDKERIKQLKKNIDVITMTATPIPRTLEFSLMGLRDISRIETAPKERMPILTRIMNWDPDAIREALQRELKRNGQIIILVNNVRNLEAYVKRFEKLVPGTRIRYAHGQMPGPELEKRLIDFYHHEYDILISTTIIESGIDIPNANTLVVFDAQNFGLSQLYQIRGRVGRSHRRAYAYLIIPSNRLISPDAEKRLRTLEYYTDLGSGYHIAMRDLEIRGGGNLFGTSQSGFINNVGYDYYLSLLNEEIERLKKGADPSADLPEIPADVNLNIDAYIPEDYISNSNQKLDQYRLLGRCRNRDDLQRFRRNIQDRYGSLPPQVEHLIEEKRISLRLQPFYIEKLTVTSSEMIFQFVGTEDNLFLQKIAGRFSDHCRDRNQEIYFSTRKGLSARISLRGKSAEQILATLFIDEPDKEEEPELLIEKN